MVAAVSGAAAAPQTTASAQQQRSKVDEASATGVTATSHDRERRKRPVPHLFISPLSTCPYDCHRQLSAEDDDLLPRLQTSSLLPDRGVIEQCWRPSYSKTFCNPALCYAEIRMLKAPAIISPH